MREMLPDSTISTGSVDTSGIAEGAITKPGYLDRNEHCGTQDLHMSSSKMGSPSSSLGNCNKHKNLLS
jgi:hypothetical protein